MPNRTLPKTLQGCGYPVQSRYENDALVQRPAAQAIDIGRHRNRGTYDVQSITRSQCASVRHTEVANCISPFHRGGTDRRSKASIRCVLRSSRPKRETAAYASWAGAERNAITVTTNAPPIDPRFRAPGGRDLMHEAAGPVPSKLRRGRAKLAVGDHVVAGRGSAIQGGWNWSVWGRSRRKMPDG